MTDHQMISRLNLLLLLVLIQGVVYAQISGPTAPEYTSFESVSASDPVQIQTGDFTYQIPLMTVPGPEGGFPIGLHYHAGIQPEQEASWIGLGWNLNVGAVNRFVNLFPDDLQGEIDEAYTYWEGGQTKVTKSAFKFLAPIYYSMKATDTFKGTRSFTSFRYGQFYNNNGFRAFHLDAEQVFWDALAIGLLNDWKISNEELASFATQTAYGYSKSLVISSLHDLANRFHLTNSDQGGGSESRSTGNNSISTNKTETVDLTKSLMVGLATRNPVAAALVAEKKTKTRYWIDERSYTAQTGSLNWMAPDNDDYFNVFDASTIPKRTGSTYPSEMQQNLSSLGGIQPSFDSYQVLSSGVGGSIAPFLFESTNLFTGNFEDKIIYEEVDTFPRQRPEFRYVGDFSNYFNLSDPSVDLYQKPGYSADYPEELFDTDLKRLASGRHVEWFTNAEINDGTAASKGFIAWDAGSDREYLKYGSTVAQKIGGFMITDETGTTYHFSLPVYTYENFQRYEQIDPPKDKKMYKHSYIPAAYAYTWLLTGITGPGYHNTYEEGVGTPGLDEADNGFWVRFDYGLWTTQHKWRTPYEGYETDADGEYQFYSRGKKELYYLDKIVTRTHTALFVKEIRRDGKGISEPFLFEYTDANGIVRTTGEFNAKGATYSRENADATEGGFSDDMVVSWMEDGDTYEIKGLFKPVSTLRLKEIVLFKNDRLESLLDDNGVENRQLQRFGEEWNHSLLDPSTYLVYLNGSLVTIGLQKQSVFQDLGLEMNENYHIADNVIDVNDFQSFKEEFYAASLSSVEFETDYALMEGTPNSLDNSELYDDYQIAEARSNGSERYGKLSLNALQFKGRGGAIGVPPTRFTYKNPSTVFPAFELGGVTYTKKDQWGYYHHLLDPAVFSENKPLAMMQTTASAPWKDTWSLASIETPTGARLELDYESDSYSKTLISAPLAIPLSNMVEGTDTLFFDVSGSGNYLDLVKNEVNNENKYAINLTVNMTFKGYSEQEFCDGNRYSLIDNGIVPSYFIYKIDLNAGEYGFDSSNRLYVTGDEISDQFSYLFDDDEAMIRYTCDTDEYSLCVPASACPSCSSGDCALLPVSGIEPAQASLNLTLKEDWLIDHPQPGGAIRVASVKITDGATTPSTLLQTNYEYAGGSTSYDPIELAYDPLFEVTIENTLPEVAFEYQEVNKEEFKKTAMGESYDVFTLGDVIPSAGIQYGTVGIKQVNVKNTAEYLSKSVYTFTDFDASLLSHLKEEDIAHVSSSFYDTLPGDVSYVKMRNLSAIGGLLKKNEIFNSDGELIFSKTNHYLHEEVEDESSFIDAYNGVLSDRKIPGRLDQQYYTLRKVMKGDERFSQMVVTEKEYYPAVLISEVSEDHLHHLKTEVAYDSFDILTGKVRKTITTNAYDEVYLNESVPAFSLHPGVGSKFSSPDNAHILIAEGKQVTKRLERDENDELIEAEVISATATQWSDQVTGSIGQWQPKNSFRWAPDEVSASTTPIAELGWKQLSEITRMDANGRVLQVEDQNGIESCIKMSLNDQHVLLQAGNAGYGEVAFSSAEYFDAARDGIDGGVTRDSRSVIAAGVAHTGYYSLGAGYARGAFEFTLRQADIVPGRGYRISVWVYMPGFAENELENAVIRIEADGDVQEVHPVKGKKSKEWYLVEAFLKPNGTSDVVIDCVNEYALDGRLIYFDDFRVQPVDATMNCYVYDRTTDEVTHIFDNNHLYAKYEYDHQGRLRKVYREIFYPADQLISEQTLNYKN